MRENAKYAETIYHFSLSFALSLFFAILYFIAKERGKCEIRGKHMSIFATFHAFAFVSQFYILSRKNAENAEYAETIYHFSKSFALSHLFAILYFIAKERGKREIRGNHMSLFAAIRSFALFRNPLFCRERTRNTRKPRYIFWAIIEHHLSICASFALLT